MALVGAALATVLLAGRAVACACCASPGMRYERSSEVNDYTAGLLGDLRPAGRAALYMTECGEECVIGVEAPVESYAVGLERDGGHWRLSFRDEQTSNAGTLTFTLPAAYHDFAVDTAPEAPNHSPALYKEWRFSAPVAGTGIFRAVGAGRSTAVMILHGTGNGCDMSRDFTHWTLSVSGPEVDFRFFGRLVASP